MAGIARRRASVALEQVEQVRDKAAGLVQRIDEALADRELTDDEIADIVKRSREVARESEEAQLAVEWTENGERRAVAGLTGRGSANAELRDMEIVRRAHDIGFVLQTA